MNASSLAAFSTRAAAVGQALWPAVVLINGVEYAATVTEPARFAGEHIAGAEEASGSLVARVLKSGLPVAPALHQALKWKRPGDAAWNAVTWFIDEVTGDNPSDAEWRISCSPKN